MEASLEDGRTRAKKKAPELEASLEAIAMLEAKQEAGETASAFYQLADNVYTKADIKPQNRVALWLGASVMVEYSYEEATKLLGEQLLAAKTKIVSRLNAVVMRVFRCWMLERWPAESTHIPVPCSSFPAPRSPPHAV